MAKASALHETQLWLRDLSLTEAMALLRANQDQLTNPHRMTGINSVEAQFRLRDLGLERPFSHPVHWAAFYCVGARRRIVALVR
jgi:CHAT domain-containing protein